MNAEQFRKLMLEVDGAVESSHAGHPDFRIAGKIFASLPDQESFGVLNLTPDAQDEFASLHPTMFEPLKGAWGGQGWTKVHFTAARVGPLRKAIAAAIEKVSRPRAKSTRTPPRDPPSKPSEKPRAGR